MPNIASVLKAEISRVARKEVRAETSRLKQAVSTYRSEIAALKRRTDVLERELRRLTKSSGKGGPTPASQEPSVRARFSAKGLASQRKRLGLSASDCGFLLGTTGQSIYNWESQKARPQAKYLPAIMALRTMRKKDATERLASLR